jgi:hypothetical protein
MQPEDILTARAGTSAEKITTVTTAWIQLVPPAPDRVSLIISAPATDTLLVTTNPGASTADGVRIANGSQALRLSIQSEGQLVTRGFYGQMSTNSSNIVTMESFAPPDSVMERSASVRPVRIVR